MKTNFTILLLVVLCQINKTFAQELHNNEQEQIIETNIKKNAIIFYPLNCFYIIEPSFQLAYERWLDNKCTVKFAGGFLPENNLYDYFSSNTWSDKSYSIYKPPFLSAICLQRFF